MRVGDDTIINTVYDAQILIILLARQYAILYKALLLNTFVLVTLIMLKLTPVKAIQASIYGGLILVIGEILITAAAYIDYYNVAYGTGTLVSIGFPAVFIGSLVFFSFIIINHLLTRRCEYFIKKRNTPGSPAIAASITVSVIMALIALGVSADFILGEIPFRWYALSTAFAIMAGVGLLDTCSCLNCCKIPFWISLAAVIVAAPSPLLGFILDLIALIIATNDAVKLSKT